MRVQAENGDPREVTIDVQKRMSENDIAKTLANALEAALAPDFKVDRDAGEHVKIRRTSRSAPKFSVEIAFSAPGFAIILDN